MNVIPYGKQHITDEDIAAVVNVLKGDYLTQGPIISTFERAFAEYVGAQYAVAVSNGTAALHLCAMAMDLKPGQKVITTPITFAGPPSSPPNQAWELAVEEKRNLLRPTPPAPLLDLHFALYLPRQVKRDHTVEFLGRSWPIAQTKRKTVTVVHHPERCFWVIPEPPSRENPVWPDILAKHSLI